MGLGWLINQSRDLCGHNGGGPGTAVSLIVRQSTGQVSVALTNRRLPVEPLNGRLIVPLP